MTSLTDTTPALSKKRIPIAHQFAQSVKRQSTFLHLAKVKAWVLCIIVCRGLQAIIVMETFELRRVHIWPEEQEIYIQSGSREHKSCFEGVHNFLGYLR